MVWTMFELLFRGAESSRRKSFESGTITYGYADVS